MQRAEDQTEQPGAQSNSKTGLSSAPTSLIGVLRVPVRKRFRVMLGAVIVTTIAAAGIVGVHESRELPNSQPAAATSSGQQGATKSDSPNQTTTNEEPMSNAKNPQSSRGSASNTSNTSVTVNGQSVDVPANGSYNKQTTTPEGTTHVQVDSTHTSTSSGSNANNSSNVRININSESSSSGSDSWDD